jgi:hypothetical protein
VVSQISGGAEVGGVDVLREVHEAAERWDGSMAEWVRRSEARVRRWTWAPPGSELHMPQVFWHERDGEAPAQEAGREPMGDEPDRYGYDAQERVAIAYRVGTAGQKRTVECFTSPDEQGVVWGARYVRDGRLAIVSRVRWVDGVPVEAISYHVREPAGDRVRMRRETYAWEGGRLARIDRVAGDWTDAGWQQKPQDRPPRYEFEYDVEGTLIGAWHAGGRLWARPTVSDSELRALEERMAKAVAAEVERLIVHAHPSGQVYCVGMSYSPGLPEDDMLWPEVALGLVDDRDRAENVSTLWDPQLMAVKLGRADLPRASGLADDARLLARELKARDRRFLHSFFDAIGQVVAAADTLQHLPATEDMLTVVIDDSEGITRDTVLRHASPRARELLLTSRWLP